MHPSAAQHVDSRAEGVLLRKAHSLKRPLDLAWLCLWGVPTVRPLQAGVCSPHVGLRAAAPRLVLARAGDVAPQDGTLPI